VLVTLKFPTKLLIASRNGKGELAFRGSFPSDAFSFMDCPFRAWNWHAPRWVTIAIF